MLKVPDVVDMHLNDIDTLLVKESNFTVELSDSIYIKGKKGGIVLEQNPRANTEVKQNRKIYLTVASYHPQKIGMPNLVDMSLRQATSLMETYGLEFGKLTYKPDLCVNCILEQHIDGKEVEQGEKVERGSVIDLVIGQGLGNELTPVPYLIEFTAEMAEALLKSKSLNIGGIIYDEETVKTAEDSLNAKVYNQMPFYSDAPSVRMGTSVDLFLTLDTNKIVHSVNPNLILPDSI